MGLFPVLVGTVFRGGAIHMGGRAHVGKKKILKKKISRHALYRPCGWPPPENRPYQNRKKSHPNQARALRDFKCFNFKESQS